MLDWCADYRRLDYARMGSKATRDVELPAGPVMTATDPPEALPHSLESQLRALEMPTQLKRGVPTLLQDFSVCKKGEKLTAEKAQILKLLAIQMAHFRLVPLAYWSAVGAAGEGKETENTVTVLSLSAGDHDAAKNAGALLESKQSSRSGSRAATHAADSDDDDDDDMDPVEARDAAMMLPPGAAV